MFGSKKNIRAVDGVNALSYKSFIWARASLFMGLLLWIGLAVLNNVFDRETNKALVSAMITMDALKADPVMGNGLEWRAWPSSSASEILNAVVLYQVLLVTALFWAVTMNLKSILSKKVDNSVISKATAAGNIALIVMYGQLFAFLIGGMWFGYWIKMGGVQTVHISLLLVTTAALLVNNMHGHSY